MVGGLPDVRLFTASTDGPADRTLLVVHGGPDWDHSYLTDPLARLAGRVRVLLADLRGCGRSTRGLPDDRYTPDAVVGDLLAVLDAFGAARADVLGFSYGGLLAQRLALAAPDRVRRLVVASSGVLPVPAVAGAPANVWRAEALPGYLRRLDAVRFSAEWLRPWRAGTLPPARPDSAARRLAAQGTPLLLLHGRQDMVFPAALAARAAELVPAARAVLLDDAGHMAHSDQPERWLAAVAEFLGYGRVDAARFSRCGTTARWTVDTTDHSGRAAPDS